MQSTQATYESFVDAAREYCRVVENINNHQDQWLARLWSLLPRIHAAVLTLGDSSARKLPEQASSADLDRRFTLYSRLHDLLGDRDPYWLTYDRREQTDRTGSLADDITDIYFELKRGLEMLDHDPHHPMRATQHWQSSFFWHWGQHLLDAERHLYDLQVHNKLHEYRPQMEASVRH